VVPSGREDLLPHEDRAPGHATRSALGHLRLGVVLTLAAVSVIGLVGLADALRAFDTRADHYASLDYLDRVYGVQRTPDQWPPRRVVEDVLATVPEDATYRVLFGPGWRSSRVTRWTDELTAGFLRYFLLPRTQTDAATAPWALCFACDASELGGRFRVLSESEDGLRFGKLEK
jgi:hypothetical protein